MSEREGDSGHGHGYVEQTSIAIEGPTSAADGVYCRDPILGEAVEDDETERRLASEAVCR